MCDRTTWDETNRCIIVSSADPALHPVNQKKKCFTLISPAGDATSHCQDTRQDHRRCLRLGYADSPARHQAAVGNEEQCNWVEFKSSALQNSSQRDVVQDPPRIQPVGHNTVQEKRRGNRCALEILALSGSILWQHRYGNVETCQSSETAEDKECQANGVDNGSQADGKSHHGRSNAKRNLQQAVLVDCARYG